MFEKINTAKYFASLSEALSIANYKSGKNKYHHSKIIGKTYSNKINNTRNEWRAHSNKKNMKKILLYYLDQVIS